MKAVILAAGLGIRMGELTKNCSKPMLPIKGRPKLAYSIEDLPEEITEVILVIGYLKEQIKEFFGNEFAGRKIKYIEQKKLNGSAGAVALVKDLVAEKILVLMGDDFYDKSDLKKLISYKQAILTYQTNQAEQFGLVGKDKDGNLLSVIERPHGKKHGLVNIGAYMLSREYFDFPKVAISKTEYGLPQTLVSMYPKHKTKVLLAEKWQPIGTPKDLAKIKREMGKIKGSGE